MEILPETRKQTLLCLISMEDNPSQQSYKVAFISNKSKVIETSKGNGVLHYLKPFSPSVTTSMTFIETSLLDIHSLMSFSCGLVM